MENQTANAASPAVPNSYAKAAQNIVFPNKEQAIVSNAIEGTSIEDYIEALSKIINPANIRFISRISNNRICTFLASKQLVEEVVEKHRKIIVNGNELDIKPLINRMKRVILSNVSPTIPHSIISDVLQKLGLKSFSSISFLRAGLTKESLSHIMSFRRQVFIQPDDCDKLPESLQIQFENSNYWIFISSGNLTCFLCKQEGHTAKHCNQTTPQSDNMAPTSSDPISTVLTNTPAEIINKQMEQSPSLTLPPTPTITIIGNKRPLPSTSNSSDSLDHQFTMPTVQDKNDVINLKTNPTPLKSSKKKPRSKSPILHSKPDMDELLAPIKPLMSDKPEEFPLNFVQLCNFLERTQGSPNALEISKEYTENTNNLIDLLHQIYPNLKQSSIKNRITRIIKKLQVSTTSNMESESDTTLETDEDAK